MKLEVGMYVRTKKGIAKILKNNFDDDGRLGNYTIDTYLEIIYDTEYIDEEDVIKASFNIIDLIEAGDYVNGIKITEIKDGKPFVEDYNDPYYSFIFNEEDIKSLVTREQFEQMEYNLPNSK